MKENLEILRDLILINYHSELEKNILFSLRIISYTVFEKTFFRNLEDEIKP